MVAPEEPYHSPLHVVLDADSCHSVRLTDNLNLLTTKSAFMSIDISAFPLGIAAVQICFDAFNSSAVVVVKCELSHSNTLKLRKWILLPPIAPIVMISYMLHVDSIDEDCPRNETAVAIPSVSFAWKTQNHAFYDFAVVVVREDRD